MGGGGQIARFGVVVIVHTNFPYACVAVYVDMDHFGGDVAAGVFQAAVSFGAWAVGVRGGRCERGLRGEGEGGG